MRHLLLPALQALQARVGWISKGGLGYICDRLNVPPADAWGVATFYALLATSPRPRRVVARLRRHRLQVPRRRRASPPRSSGPLDRRRDPAPPTSNIRPRTSASLHDLRLDAVAVSRQVRPGAGGAGDDRRRASSRATARPRDGRSRPGDPRWRLRPTNRRWSTTLRQPVSELRLLRRVGRVDPASLEAYRASGGFAALDKALRDGGRPR